MYMYIHTTIRHHIFVTCFRIEGVGSGLTRVVRWGDQGVLKDTGLVGAEESAEARQETTDLKLREKWV